MKNFSLGLCLLATVSLVACSKKSDLEPVQPTKTDNISASAWTYQEAGLDANRDGMVDAGGSLTTLLPTLVPTCRTDNFITFKKDNTGLVDEGATKCNMADASQTSFNWNFADNEANLVVSNNVFGLLNGKSKIVALTTTSFTLTRDTVLGGTTYPIVVLLKH